jgi:hypothetical protein
LASRLNGATVFLVSERHREKPGATTKGEDVNRNFQIIITDRANGDLALITTVKGAPAMEDEVTRLHREYPAHMFDCVVTFA